MTLRQWDHPDLKAKCEPLVAGDDVSFLQTMKQVCKANRGVGLAAPQIGILKRAIFIMPIGRGACFSMLNPKILQHSDKWLDASEGCLSYPGIFAVVCRAESIEVAYHDWQWKPQQRWFFRWEARIIQHEIDHLDGICKVGKAWQQRRSA